MVSTVCTLHVQVSTWVARGSDPDNAQCWLNAGTIAKALVQHCAEL